MKRIILFICVVLSTSHLWANNRYGISLGVNLGSIKTDWENMKEPEIFPRFGYSLGLGTELPLKKQMSLLIDMNLVSKNYAYAPEFYGIDIEGFDRYSLLYFDLPLRISYNYKKTRVFTGTFIDYCISGTNRYNFTYPDSTVSEGNKSIKSGKQFSKNEIHSDRLAVNSMDGGLIFGVGYHDDNYCLDLSYSLGLLNTYPEIKGGQDRRKNITRTRMLQLNLFFYF
jgi:hypothetical protein